MLSGWPAKATMVKTEWPVASKIVMRRAESIVEPAASALSAKTNTRPSLTVIDCSAMVELLAAKTHTGDAIARRVTSAQTLYAPYVLDGEVISALLGLMRGQKISEREADADLKGFAFAGATHKQPRPTLPPVIRAIADEDLAAARRAGAPGGALSRIAV